MKKSVYSLVLSDDVIAAIDRMAYAKGMSRSGMINELLASVVSYTTPEMWVRRVLSKIADGLGSGTFVPMPAGANAYSMRSALAYKYNPSLRFSVELDRRRSEDGGIGEMKISLRSRSESLLLLLVEFFKLWQAIENEFAPDTRWFYSDGKISRRLVPSDPNAPAEDVGDAIGRYALCINDAIGVYFSDTDRTGKKIAEKMRGICSDYYLSGSLTV